MSRPSFAAVWAASMQIYAPLNTGKNVAKIIGGNVEKTLIAPMLDGDGIIHAQ